MRPNLIRNQQVVGSIPTAGFLGFPRVYGCGCSFRQVSRQGVGQGIPDDILAARFAAVRGARRGFDAVLARASQDPNPDALLERAAELLKLRSTLLGHIR